MESKSTHQACSRSAASPGYAVHVDGTDSIGPELQKQLDKFAGLLRKHDLMKSGNAGVDESGQIVDIRENPKAVRLPPHNVVISHGGKDLENQT